MTPSRLASSHLPGPNSNAGRRLRCTGSGWLDRVRMRAGLALHALLVLLVLFLTTSCAPPKPVAAPVNLSGFPQAFRDGYGDGCASAGGRVHQDAKRFEGDRQYAAGWRDGLDACRRRAQKPAG